MTPSYQVLSGLAKVFAIHARPWEQLLDEAAAIIGEGADGTCLIGVRVRGSAVFDPVGGHRNERLRQALMSDTPGFTWPVSDRAKLVLASGTPFIGSTSTNASAQADNNAAQAPWEGRLQGSGRLPNMMLAIRFGGVGVGVVALTGSHPEPAYTEADAQDLEGPVDVLAVALHELSIRPDGDTLTDSPPQATHSNLATLNDREREVIVLMAQGLTTAEIGETMYLSARTVEWYRARILRKLDHPTRAELVALGRSFTSSR